MRGLNIFKFQGVAPLSSVCPAGEICAGNRPSSASAASSPIRPIRSTDDLDLYHTADWKKAMEHGVDRVKPPRVVDNAYIEAYYAQYDNVRFSDNPVENEKIKFEAVKSRLANDFWRMDGGRNSQQPVAYIVKAEDALHKYLNRQMVREEISDPKLRINNERLGWFYQQLASERQMLDGFALSNRELAMGNMDGYIIPSDPNMEVVASFDFESGNQGELSIKTDIIPRSRSGRKDYMGIDNPVYELSTRFGGGLGGILPLISPEYYSESAFGERHKKGKHHFDVPASEILTPEQAIQRARSYKAVAEVNQLVAGRDEEGVIKGFGIVHPHFIEDAGALTRSKRMVADLLRDKSLRKYLSRDFARYRRNVSADTEIGLREFQGYLSSSDFQTLFSTGFSVPGHRTRALFSATAEMDKYGDKINRVNVIDTIGSGMTQEEADYRIALAGKVIEIIGRISAQGTYRIDNPQDAALIVEHYLGMKDITVNQMPSYVETTKGVCP